MNQLLQNLNPQQRAAVCYDEGGLLVLAGAGTGKTRVLTSRIIRLLQEKKAAPHNILAVTFTNKAATEMRQRIESALGNRLQSAMIGTFHGISHRLLRYHAVAAGLDKNFQILDSQDQLTFIRRLLKENNINDKETTPQEVRSFINRCKTADKRSGAVVPQHSREEPLLPIYSLYEKKCRAENKVDFAELLLATLELLQKDATLRQHYSERFCHVLVDELQDTNQQQFKWLRQFDNKDNCYFGVGDDDQSIYAFRGAQPRIMQRFQSEFRANHLIRLEANYRSVATILDAANHLIKNNTGRLGKTLKPSINGGDKISVFPLQNETEESNEVATMVRGQIAQNTPPAEIAVLYRTNAQSRLLERAMMNRGIYYKVYGGQRFYDRQEIKHALAYLRLAVSDDVDSLWRVINFPTRGIGTKAMDSLNPAPFTALQHTANPKIMGFRHLLQGVRERAVQFSSLAQMVRLIIEDSGLLTHYEDNNEQERADNIRELVNAATEFERQNNSEDDEVAEHPLIQFLSTTALDSDSDSDNQKQAVNLMTVHAAKGLEFKKVHIVGLEEELFPHKSSLDDSDAIEEERRLMYVAMTRAKESLAVYYTGQRLQFGKTVYNPVSRFLEELPHSCTNQTEYSEQMDEVAKPTAAYRPNVTKAANATKAVGNGAGYRPAGRGMGGGSEDISSGGIRSEGIRLGSQINHRTYGHGIVTGQSGTGKNRQIKIAFLDKKVGEKTFMADIVLKNIEKI